jgi:hypothetical protein
MERNDTPLGESYARVSSKFGRKRKLSEYQRKEAIKPPDAGDETLAQIAQSYGAYLNS